MYHIAICDDLPEERAVLKRLLSAFAAQRQLSFSIAEFSNGEALVADAGVDFDLVFLDIFMGGMNGMETAKNLRAAGVRTPIVFLTTSPDFAMESYEVVALSYLLKPVFEARLVTVLEQFLQNYHPRSVLLQGRLFMVEDLVFAESRNKKILLHFNDGGVAELLEKLDTVEAALSSRNFLRCHQSFIVNMDYVRCMEGESFQTILGVPVLIRKREFPAMRKKYYEYLTSL